MALGLSLGSYSFAFWEEGITLEDESIYNYLQVKETDSSVILSTNVLFGVQSILMKHAKLTGMYYDYALAAPLMAGIDSQTPGSILILGLGTGTFAKYCSEYFPECSIEGVEIDEKIAREERGKMVVLAEGHHILWIPALGRCSAYYYVTEDTTEIIQADLSLWENDWKGH